MACWQPRVRRRLACRYATVHDLQFISAADAAFLNDEDRIIGVMSGKTGRL